MEVRGQEINNTPSATAKQKAEGRHQNLQQGGRKPTRMREEGLEH